MSYRLSKTESRVEQIRVEKGAKIAAIGVSVIAVR